jgi:phosphoribosylanthranilate isomerase
MKIKICGMKYQQNVNDISALPIDYMGFIFYPSSPRFVGELDRNILNNIPNHIQKVAVFVNSSVGEICSIVEQYQFDLVQLHGKESVEDCKYLYEQKINVIKAFSINEKFSFSNIESYTPFCNYFLFDTATNLYGGSGKQFNWNLLENYNYDTPFFISGGIGLSNIESALQFKHSKLFALDINSKIEDSAAFKNIDQAKKIIQKIKTHENI